MFSKQKIGLVLAGGGGKGSCQLGVWKYLEEIGLTKMISVISGTSVGGLNAALLSLCSLETAQKIWTTHLEGTILDFKSHTKRSGAIFSREGLLHIIDNYMNLPRLPDLKRKLYVTCFNVRKKKTESFCLNNYDTEEVKQLLCATSAIPIVFQEEKISGNYYADGGLGDEVPIGPLLDEGCTDAIVVNLRRSYHVDYSGLGINTAVIHPTADLGDKTLGLLDFSAKGAEWRMQLGYDDCKNKFAPILKALRDEPHLNQQETQAMQINAMDDKTVLKKTLEVIADNPKYLKDIQGMFNIDLPTAGGKTFWVNLAEHKGWRFQENDFVEYVRLLDPANKHRAWGRRRQLVDYCRSFLIGQLNT